MFVMFYTENDLEVSLLLFSNVELIAAACSSSAESTLQLLLLLLLLSLPPRRKTDDKIADDDKYPEPGNDMRKNWLDVLRL